MSRVRCKVCGYEFEFKGPSTLDTVNTVLAGFEKFTAALSGNVFTYAAADNIAKNSEFQVKCPNCHSTNVEGIFEERDSTTAPAISINTNASIDALLKRAALFLEDGEWDTANVYYNQILDAEPENSIAYFGKLMAELHCHSQEELQNCEEPFDGNANYKKALRFGSEDQKTALLGYIEAIKTRNEHKLLDTIYQSAVKKMRDAVVEEDFQQAIAEFQRTSGWKDAVEKIAVCQKRIEELRTQNEQKAKRNRKFALIAAPFVIAIIVAAVFANNADKYNNAVALMDAGNYGEAAQIFTNLGSYKDSNEKLNEALEAASLVEMEESYQNALELLTETSAEAHGSAYQILQELGDYKDAKEMLADFQLLESYWKWEYTGSEVSSQKTFEYSSSAYQMTVESNGTPTSYKYEFNEQGQLLTCQGNHNYLLEYRYHPNGEIAYSSYPYIIDGETNKYIGFFETEYDTNGMPVSMKYRYEDEYENQWNWDYHYAEDGNIVSVDVRYQRGKDEGFLTVDLESQGLELVVNKTGTEVLKYRTVSEDGKKETIYNVIWKNKALVFSELTVSEYDDHHNVIVKIMYTNNSEGSKYAYQYTYDEKGQIITSTNEYAGSTTEYTYDEYGNCIKEITKDADGDVTNRTTRRYDYFYTPNAQ